MILPQIVDKSSYENYHLFEYLLENEIDDLKIIDFNYVITVFAILMNLYINFVKKYDFKNDFYIFLELTNYELSIPYFDNEIFIKAIFDKIIPVNLKQKICTPYDAKYMELDNQDFNFEKFFVIFLQTSGIPVFIIEESLRGIVDYFKKINTKDNEN